MMMNSRKYRSNLDTRQQRSNSKHTKMPDDPVQPVHSSKALAAFRRQNDFSFPRTHGKAEGNGTPAQVSVGQPNRTSHMKPVLDLSTAHRQVPQTKRGFRGKVQRYTVGFK